MMGDEHTYQPPRTTSLDMDLNFPGYWILQNLTVCCHNLTVCCHNYYSRHIKGVHVNVCTFHGIGDHP